MARIAVHLSDLTTLRKESKMPRFIAENKKTFLLAWQWKDNYFVLKIDNDSKETIFDSEKLLNPKLDKNSVLAICKKYQVKLGKIFLDFINDPQHECSGWGINGGYEPA